MSLIYEASQGTIGVSRAKHKQVENPISFRDRGKLLDSVTKLLGAQETPDDEEQDGISSYRERLNERDGGETGSRADSDAE